MHRYDTWRGWDRLVNRAQEKTLKNMLHTTAIPSCLPSTLICLKYPLVPPGTTILSLGCTFIRRDLKHEHFGAKTPELPVLGLHFTCRSLALYSPRGSTVWKLFINFDKFALKPEEQIFQGFRHQI